MRNYNNQITTASVRIYHVVNQMVTGDIDFVHVNIFNF